MTTVQTGVMNAADEQRVPGWWESLGPIGVAKVLLVVSLLSWFYGDHLYRLFRYWQQPDWSHGFLLPPFCLYLIHTRRKELLAGTHHGSLWGAALIILAVTTYTYSIYLKIGYPQPLTILVMLAGIVLLIRGWRTLWMTIFPIGFLVLAIPPPVRLYREITQPLQQAAAFVSAHVLNAFPGVESVERAGINLAYYMNDGVHGTFTVANACSGMRSLMAFVALGLAMAYFTPRPLWHRVALAAFVVPVALFCNILRVIITGGLQMYGHKDLATGTPHSLLGLLMFALGFVIYLAFLWVLDHLFIEENDPPTITAKSIGGV